MNIRTIIEYVLAVILVLILGGLAGWYFFLRTQTKTITSQSAARGFDTAIPQGNADGVSGLSPTGVSPSTPAQSSSPQTSTPAQRPPQLWHVETKPVAGQTFVGSGGGLRLRYVERASGYVFEADPATGQFLRLSNTLLPKVYEAVLTENGHVFVRSLDSGGSITTFAGTVSTSTSSASSSAARTLLGSYLAKNIASMGAHPQSGSLFYLVKNADGVSGVTSDWNGAKLKTIFASTIPSWRPTVLGDGRIILVQAAADNVAGYAYELKKDGTLSPIAGPVSGLTMLVRPLTEKNAPNAFLFGQSVRGTMTLFVRVGQNATAVQLPIKTLADKCVWGKGKELVAYCGVPQGLPSQNYLDEWYRGAVHSSDALWRINASAGSAELLYTPPSNTPIDIEKMSIDRGANYITFTNAADGSLWLLRLAK